MSHWRSCFWEIQAKGQPGPEHGDVYRASYAAAGAKCFVRRRLPYPQPWSLDAAATPVKEIVR